jgi:hypothetical protein
LFHQGNHQKKGSLVPVPLVRQIVVDRQLGNQLKRGKAVQKTNLAKAGKVVWPSIGYSGNKLPES